jgi:hypothetical protein
MVAVRAWPRWSWPVTFGGGNKTENVLAFSKVSAFSNVSVFSKVSAFSNVSVFSNVSAFSHVSVFLNGFSKLQFAAK